MAGEVGLVLQLILQLLPMLKPSEIAKLKEALVKFEEDWNEDKQKLLKALEDGDLHTINTVLAELLELYED